MPVATGSLAPSAQAVALAGGAVDLAALAAGGPALLFFYKGECDTSAAAAHALPRLAAVRGVAVAAVSQDDAAQTGAFAQVHAFSPAVHVLLDLEPWPASHAFDVRVTPTWVLLAPGGRVEAVLEGWSRDEANALAARAAVLAGAPAPLVSTAADGPAFRPG